MVTNLCVCQTSQASPSASLTGGPTMRTEVSHSSTSMDVMWSAINCGSLCICKKRKTIHRKHWQFGSLYLYSELTSYHSPHCPLAKKTFPSSKKEHGLRYTGLAQAVKATIGVSFYKYYGAGKSSIGPNFTYYPTVNREKDPAFRVIDLLFLFNCKRIDGLNITENVIKLCHQKAIGAIARIFASGTTSPLVVNVSNESLMHALFFAYK